MDDLTREHVRYLERRLARCWERPDLHRYQIAAYQHLLLLARRAKDWREYDRALERSGGLFSLVQAEHIDRHDNARRRARALQDDVAFDHARRAGEAAAEGTDMETLRRRGTEVEAVAEREREGAAAAREAVGDLLAAIVGFACERRPELRVEHAARVRRIWARITGLDPACTWEKLASYPPYRQRIPFDLPRIAQMRDLFVQAVS